MFLYKLIFGRISILLHKMLESTVKKNTQVQVPFGIFIGKWSNYE